MYIDKEWQARGAAFGVGVAVGYFVAKRMLRETVEVVEETTIETTVEIDENADSEEIRASIASGFARAAMEQYAGEDAAATEEIHRQALSLVADPEPEMSSYEDDIEWDQEEEEENRGPDAPYVIHIEEWHRNESDYTQQDLHFYAGDDILADEQNVPIYDHGKIVGRLEFGRGSGNSDIVFIRNEKLKAEYQVIRVEHSYQQEVLGIEAEEAAEEEDLRHSRHRVIKLRDD